MKQSDAVIQTIERLGGLATLGQLNHEVFKIKECEWKTKTPFASIRRIVQLHTDIYKIRPGLYGLCKFKSKFESQGVIEETEKNRNSKEVQAYSHAYYQGLLMTIGNLRGYDTYVPNQDKNKPFAGGKLGNLRTLRALPIFGYKDMVERSSTIDVIWFNGRRMPESFFEIEHSTDIQNSLIKFADLRDFSTRMMIVADIRRKEEFLKKIKYSVFDCLKRCHVDFLSYDDLVKQYNQAMEASRLNTRI